MTDSRDFVSMMSALMSDLSASRITSKVADLICNAGGKVHKVFELEAKYGTSGANGRKVLALTGPRDDDEDSGGKE